MLAAAIEDLTTFPPGIKLDTYPNILFLNLVLATLDDHRYGSGWFAGSGPQPPEELHRFHRLRMWQANAEAFGNFLPRTPSTDLGPGNFPLMYSIRGSRAWQVEDDPRDAMRWCNVALEPVSIFLHSSNTLISVFANEADEVIQPILDRLNSPTTLLRRSQDASFLMESLLDGIIDRLVQVVEEYADELEGMERLVFTRPRQLHTKQLHLILLELHALRRLISPLDSILETLRHIPAQSHNHSLPDRALGFVSRLTRFYLADVADHLRFSLEELTALETRITDLSGLVSNLINHQVNTSMRVLALLSLVFLPLTFVAGVYGMNFQSGFPFRLSSWVRF